MIDDQHFSKNTKRLQAKYASKFWGGIFENTRNDLRLPAKYARKVCGGKLKVTHNLIAFFMDSNFITKK